jgi:hypothetical protein
MGAWSTSECGWASRSNTDNNIKEEVPELQAA